jgi:hypothetical protein
LLGRPDLTAAGHAEVLAAVLFVEAAELTRAQRPKGPFAPTHVRLDNYLPLRSDAPADAPAASPATMTLVSTRLSGCPSVDPIDNRWLGR